MNYFTERIYMYITYVYKVLPSFWKVTECFLSLRVLVNFAVLVFFMLFCLFVYLFGDLGVFICFVFCLGLVCFVFKHSKIFRCKAEMVEVSMPITSKAAFCDFLGLLMADRETGAVQWAAWRAGSPWNYRRELWQNKGKDEIPVTSSYEEKSCDTFAL